MTKYKFFYLIWLLPAWMAFLCIHQTEVFYSIVNTYENGSSYTARVVDYQLKQVAAQTNGYVVLQFETGKGQKIKQKLSLPVEMAEKVSDLGVIPVRYQEGAFENIVMMPTFSMQKSIVLTNAGIAFIGFLATFFIAVGAHRYANKKLAEGEQEFIIERVDRV